MLYALTESSLISSLPLSISPSFSATPYLPHSLWIALCLPVLPRKCRRTQNFKGGRWNPYLVRIGKNNLNELSVSVLFLRWINF